jgi:GAF domain-containing protein
MLDKQPIMGIAQSFMKGESDRNTFFRDLTRSIATQMACSRASVWKYADPLLQESAECLCLYDASQENWTAGARLSNSEFAPYFEAMRRDGVIVAADAARHPATACFNDSYFGPHNIVSLLDVGITISGEAFGLFCCENTAVIVDWTPEQINYLQQIGAVVGMALRRASKA